MKESYLKAKEEYINTNLTLREISKKYKLCRHKFSKYLNSIGINTKRKLNIKEDIFNIIDTEEKAYWLGFLYADGYVCFDKNKKQYSVELGLKKSDFKHVFNFKNFLKTDKKIYYKDKTNSYKIQINSKLLVKDLINKGCISKKSLILIFPSKEQVPRNLLNHFIRGYFDGDGSIFIKGISPDLRILGTFEFLKSLQNELNIGIIKKDKRHLNNTFYLKLNVKDSLFLLNYMYKNCNIYLDRKFEKYNNLKNCRSDW